MLDFAAYIQKSMENAAIKKINYLIKRYNIENICIGGGVGLNCVMNTKIRRNTKLKEMFIPPASGDTGQAVGNAIYGFYNKNKVIPDLSDFDVYMGSEIKTSYYLTERYRAYCHIQLSDIEKNKIAAVLLQKGKIIGWCQNRSEWGPRALGNRSILCRTDIPSVAKKLRDEIKERNWFEPFAASVLRTDISVYFDTNNELPYMLEVAMVKKDKASFLQNCIHIDGSCRVQTVSKERNQQFHDLLFEFKKLTGDSVILNTSLNQRGAPICETAEDAFNFFITSKLEIIFIANDLIIKNRILFEEIKYELFKLRHASIEEFSEIGN